MSREKGPSPEEMGIQPQATPENGIKDFAERVAENDIDFFIDRLEDEMASAVMEKMKAGTPEEAKEAYLDSLKLSKTFDRLPENIKGGNFDITVAQESVDELVNKYGLNPKSFSLEKAKELFAKLEKEIE